MVKVAPSPSSELDGDRAADLLGKAEHLAEAQAGAFAEALGGEEWLEHAVHHLGRHPGAVVRDFEHHMLALEAFGLAGQDLVVRADLERTALGHRVACVERQVQEHQLERACIRVDRPQLVRDLGDNLDVAAQRRTHQGRDVREELLEVDLLDLERLRAGEREQLLGEACAAVGRAADAFQHSLYLVGIVDVPKPEFARAEDCRQQVVEVMGEAAGQLAERFHFLRPEQLLAAVLELQLRLALLGHVARDLGEADQLAAIVADRVEHDACPEAAAVLAHAPPFRFVPANLPSGFERAMRNAGFEILRRVEFC